MPKKDNQKRLIIPKDLWDIVKFEDYDRNQFGFFIADDSRVIIAPISFGKELSFDFIGACHFDSKHRFFVPNNVDSYFGNPVSGEYYMSINLCHTAIYIYPVDRQLINKRQNAQISMLLAIIKKEGSIWG